MISQRLMLVVNSATFFLSHRLQIALEAQKAGFEVHVATPLGPDVEKIVSHGLIYHSLPITRSGMNLISEFKVLILLFWLFRTIKPDLVHLVTIKPVLYGGIAARLARVRGVVAAISGLGFVFSSNGLKATLVKTLVAKLYQLVLGKRNLKVIFQNFVDCETLQQLTGLVATKMVMIKGSGVDLSDYIQTPSPEGIPVVIMAARLLRDKGVYEFLEAARLLQKRNIMAEFWLAGEPDKGNPASVTELELLDWESSENVKLLGNRSDIAHVFAQSSVVVLPSYYREGLPKVLMEAAACGRAVVTTDMPGCRDAIEPNVTGLLVPPRDAVALADAIQCLLYNTKLRERMGQAGRLLAEREFSIEKVVSAHLEVYNELLEIT